MFVRFLITHHCIYIYIHLSKIYLFNIKNDCNSFISAKVWIHALKIIFIVKLFQCLGPFIKYKTIFLHLIILPNSILQLLLIKFLSNINSFATFFKINNILSEYVQKTCRILINLTTGNHEFMLIVSIKYISFKSYFFQFILIWHKKLMFLKNREPTLYNFLKNLLSFKIRWKHSILLIWVF